MTSGHAQQVRVQKRNLLNHFVGFGEQCRWNLHAQCLCCLEIDE